MSAPRPRPTLRSLAVLGALGTSALLLTGCTGAGTVRSSAVEAAAPTQAAAPVSPRDEDSAERRALLQAAKVTWDKAADIAAERVPDGKLVEIELTGAPNGATTAARSPKPGTPGPTPAEGGVRWEAEVATPDGTLHRIDIDAVDGRILRTRVVSDQDAADKRETADRLTTTAQSPQQAVAAATGTAKGTVTGVDLDEDDGRGARWTVEVVPAGTWGETTFEIDATDGTVLAESADDN